VCVGVVTRTTAAAVAAAAVLVLFFRSWHSSAQRIKRRRRRRPVERERDGEIRLNKNEEIERTGDETVFKLKDRAKRLLLLLKVACSIKNNQQQ